MGFAHDEKDLPKHFAEGDLVMSHVIALLSAVFPEGEDFFVRSVRAYRDQIEDPELRKQVAGFIGQEANHGKEHRAINERLGRRGYRTRLLDRETRRVASIAHRVLPARHQLAITVAAEHYTAILAEVILRDERARRLTTVPEVHELFLWHALEENEHKSVAFDVFQAAVGDERLRTRTMDVMTVALVGGLVLGTAASLALDPSSRNLPRLVRSLARLRHNPFASKALLAQARDYNRRGFHPDDSDTTALVEQWKEELFGEQGALRPVLKGATLTG